jgi:hypothetical protein
MASKTLKFSTNRNSRLNTIQQGYMMQEKFRKSPRWELINNIHGDYARNDHDFHHSGFNIWRDVNKGTWVKEKYSSNRQGRINNLVFSQIPNWPEQNKNETFTPL